MVKARIYKITTPNSNKIYIGSTTLGLTKRMNRHRFNKKCSSYELIQLGNTTIELIEEFEAENKEKIREKEQYYLTLNNDILINKYKAHNIFENKKEKNKYYYENDKEGAKERIKRYRLKYNEDIKCECGGHYKRYYKTNHERTKLHINYLNQPILTN